MSSDNQKDNQKDNKSLRYSIPNYFNPTPYCVYKAVRRLFDRSDIPPVHLPLRNRFTHYFTKILHFGTDAKNHNNDYLKNAYLTKICGNILDEELDNNLIANSDFLKLALNILRDYLDSMKEVDKEFYWHDIYQLNDIVKIIEKYLDYIADPDSIIECDKNCD